MSLANRHKLFFWSVSSRSWLKNKNPGNLRNTKLWERERKRKKIKEAAAAVAENTYTQMPMWFTTTNNDFYYIVP